MPDPFGVATLHDEDTWTADHLAAQANPALPPSRIHLPGRRELEVWGTEGAPEFASQSAGKRFGLLSVPEKLQCPAWDTLSGYTCPGAAASTRFATRQRLGVCWLCYASYGPQRFFHGSKAYWRMMFAASDDFVDTMVKAIHNPLPYLPRSHEARAGVRNRRFFRIHSAGDFSSPDYIVKWGEIIGRCPDTLFWAPTRCWTDITPKQRAALQRLARSHENVCVRPSGLCFNDPPPVVEGMSGGQTTYLYERAYVAVKGMTDERGRPLEPDFIPGHWQRLLEAGVWLCPSVNGPAAQAKSGKLTCVNARGPDGQAPCRMCWGVDSQGRPDFSEMPVAYAFHFAGRQLVKQQRLVKESRLRREGRSR